MNSLKTFLKKRYGNALVFASPIILASIFLGLLGQWFDTNNVSQETADGILILGMTLLILLTAVVILFHKPLPGILGKWQSIWQTIPSWKTRLRK